MTDLIATHVRTDDGHEYADPDEQLLYQLFLEVEGRGQGHLILTRRVDGADPQHLTAARLQDGSYQLVEHHVPARPTMAGSMAMAHDAVCRWAAADGRPAGDPQAATTCGAGPQRP